MAARTSTCTTRDAACAVSVVASVRLASLPIRAGVQRSSTCAKPRGITSCAQRSKECSLLMMCHQPTRDDSRLCGQCVVLLQLRGDHHVLSWTQSVSVTVFVCLRRIADADADDRRCITPAKPGRPSGAHSECWRGPGRCDRREWNCCEHGRHSQFGTDDECWRKRHRRCWSNCAEHRGFGVDGHCRDGQCRRSRGDW